MFGLGGGVLAAEEGLVEVVDAGTQGVNAGIHAAFHGVDARVEAMLYGTHASIQAPEKTEHCNAGSNDRKDDLGSVGHAGSVSQEDSSVTVQPADDSPPYMLRTYKPRVSLAR